MTSGNLRLRAAFCSIIILLSIFVSSSHSARCCLRYRRRLVPCSQLLDYTVQTIGTSCDIHAIIFHVKGAFVCADPLMNWTQRGMSCVDEMKKKMEDVIKNRTHVAT